MNKLHVLIPAAGCSSRLGTNKQLVDFDGETLLRRAVRRVIGAGFLDITIVTGFEPLVTQAAVLGLGCRLVHNEDWEQGLGSTLARGVSVLANKASAVLVVLPDQFLIEAYHLLQLAKQHALTPRNLIASHYEGVVGVPAIFPDRLFPELKGLAGQPGARALFQKYRAETIFRDCPEAAHDLDTPDDLAKLKTRTGSRARPGEAPLR